LLLVIRRLRRKQN